MNGPMTRGSNVCVLILLALSAAHGAGDKVAARSDPLEWGRNKLLSVLNTLSPRSRRPSPPRAAPESVPPSPVIPRKERASPSRAPLPSKAAPPLTTSAPASHRPTSPGRHGRGQHTPPRELRLRAKPSSRVQGESPARDARLAVLAPGEAGAHHEEASLPARSSGEGGSGRAGIRSVSAGAGGGRQKGGKVTEVRCSQVLGFRVWS